MKSDIQDMKGRENIKDKGKNRTRENPEEFQSHVDTNYRNSKTRFWLSGG